MKPPASVKVGHRTYTIKVTKDIQAHGVVGRCDHRYTTIYIDPDQAPSEIKETAVHEVLHAIWYSTGAQSELSKNEGESDFDLEERLVSKQSPRLMEFLVDNPDFLAWLQAS